MNSQKVIEVFFTTVAKHFVLVQVHWDHDAVAESKGVKIIFAGTVKIQEADNVCWMQLLNNNS